MLPEMTAEWTIVAMVLFLVAILIVAYVVAVVIDRQGDQDDLDG